MDTVMPICLPRNKGFRDTQRTATAVGMGIKRRAKSCYTDGNGPEVFQTCSTKWIRNSDKSKDEYEEYKNTYGSYGCEKSQPPPSSENAICKKYHEKIGQLKENPNREDIDENFVKEFLTRPTESLLIPTDEIRFGK